MTQVFVQSNGEGGWFVRVHPPQPPPIIDEQKQARRLGILMAKAIKCEFVLCGENGEIREKNSYGKDPRKTRG